MALSLLQVRDMLKTQFLPVVIDHIRSDDYIQKYINKFEKKEDVAYEFEKAYRYSYSEGTKMMPDFTGQIANPAQTIYKKVKGSVKWRTGAIKIYKAIAHLMNKDRKAFVHELENEVKGISESMKAEANRMAYGDGGLTPLAICAADATASTASPILVTLAAGSTTKFLRPGMPLDFLTTAHAAIENGTENYIENVVGNDKFTFKTSVTGTALTTLLEALNGALIYHHGGYQNETQGLGSIISDSNTLLGVDRSTDAGAWFRAQEFHVADGLQSGGATGTLDDWDILDIEQAIEVLVMRHGADKQELKIFTTSGIEKYAVSLYRTFGEASLEREKIDLWAQKVITIGSVPVLTSYSMPDNRMYIPDMSGFVKFNGMDLDFDETDGSMWKWVSGYAAYTAWLMEAFELGHWTPWRCAAIYDLKTKYTL
jgi:hypothetical protein